MKFVLEIELGNDDVQNGKDVKRLLKKYLEAISTFDRKNDYIAIMDNNGNKVGTAEIVDS